MLSKLRFGSRFVLLFVVLCLGLSQGALAQNDSNIPVPQLNASEHHLASGDFLLVQFYDGLQEQEYKVQVDGAGALTLPLVGTITVAGRFPAAAAALLTEHYQQYYNNPSVAIQVLEYGKIQVFAFGTDFVGRIFDLDNESDLLDILRHFQSFHGIKNMAQYRRIHVVRGGVDFRRFTSEDLPVSLNTGGTLLSAPSPSVVARREGQLERYQNWRPWLEERVADPASDVLVIDSLNLYTEGDLAANNLALQDKDVLFVPAPEQFVSIAGVAKEGVYELLGGETLGDVLRLAGSVDYSYDLSNAVVQRYDDCGQLERVILNLYPALDELECVEGFALRNRDQIVIAEREDRVFVLGQVNIPGAFPFAEDSTVVDYIAQCGLHSSAHTAWIAIIRQSRNRFDVDGPAEVIQVNFKDLHKGLILDNDTHVLPGDVIYVPTKGFTFNVNTIMQAVGTVATTFAVLDNVGSSDTTTSEDS